MDTADPLDAFKARMRQLRQEAIEVAAAAEAKWDGRDFSGFSKSEKQRYMDRFEAAMDAYSKHVLGGIR